MQTLHLRFATYYALSRTEIRAGDQLFEFTYKSDAIAFLDRMTLENHDPAQLRRLLASHSWPATVGQFSDAEVVGHLANLLVDKSLLIAKTRGNSGAKQASMAGGQAAELPKTENWDLLKQRPRPRLRPVYDEDKDKEEDAQKDKKTWIEIELIGEDKKPIPNIRYLIEKPNKSKVAAGWLDKDGFAREDNLDPGNYMVSFPELDKDAWHPL